MAEHDDSLIENLVRNAQSGDRDALDNLLRRIAPLIASVCRSCPADAREDIAQDARIKVIQSLDRLRDSARLFGWVRTIVHREILIWARRNAQEQETLTRWQTTLDLETGSPDEPNNDRGNVREAVHRLPPSQRELIYDHYVLGKSYAETSGQREIPLTALKSRLHRARRRLQKELSMTQSAPAIDLTAHDLDAIARAIAFTAKNDPKRPTLGGVLLDNEGFAVATDGHRLLVAEASGLAQFDEPVIVDVNPQTLREEPALVSVRLDEVHLRFADDEIAWPLVSGDFPDYRAALPSNPKLRATLDAGQLNAALDAMTPHLDDAHPQRDGFVYLPAIYVEPDARAQTLTLTTSQSLGYHLANDGLADRPMDDLDWRFSVAIACTAFEGFSDSFRMKVNAHYLRDAVVSLGSSVTLSFSRADHSLDLASGNDRAVIMPIA